MHWGNRQHFLYTTAAAARGFCDMATLARRAGRIDDVAHYKQLADQTRAPRSTANFIDSSRVLAGSLERLAQGANYHDGSTVEAMTWSLVDPTDPIANATLGGDVAPRRRRPAATSASRARATSTTPTSGS